MCWLYANQDTRVDSTNGQCYSRDQHRGNRLSHALTPAHLHLLDFVKPLFDESFLRVPLSPRCTVGTLSVKALSASDAECICTRPNSTSKRRRRPELPPRLLDASRARTSFESIASLLTLVIQHVAPIGFYRLKYKPLCTRS